MLEVLGSTNMPKILLVDDDDYIRNGMKKFFEIEKYEVKTASTGAEASALLDSAMCGRRARCTIRHIFRRLSVV